MIKRAFKYMLVTSIVGVIGFGSSPILAYKPIPKTSKKAGFQANIFSQTTGIGYAITNKKTSSAIIGVGPKSILNSQYGMFLQATWLSKAGLLGLRVHQNNLDFNYRVGLNSNCNLTLSLRKYQGTPSWSPQVSLSFGLGKSNPRTPNRSELDKETQVAADYVARGEISAAHYIMSQWVQAEAMSWVGAIAPGLSQLLDRS